MIRVEKLSLSYRGGLSALRSIDLHISPREDIALIGANGSGKTTLAHCLNGLLQPQTGRVLVDGMDASDPTQLRAIRQLVGMVSQNPDDQLVATTVADELAFGLENLALASDKIHRRVEETLAAFDIEAYRHYPPHKLSGGEKQRVAIAAVVAMRPRYLVLDESTALLDPGERQQVAELLQRLRTAYGIATILITQTPEEAARADRVIVLHAGRIRADSSPAALFADPPKLRAFGLDLPFASALAAHLSLAEIPLTLDTLSDALTALKHQTSLSPWTPPTPPPPAPSKLATTGLTYLYDEHLPTQRRGIRDITMDVPTGSVLALVGTNGAGKTTLAQHFNALIKPSRGRVLLDGYDIGSQPPARVRQRVGLAFQFPELQLFAETVAEDVAFGPRNLGFAPERVNGLVAHSLAMIDMPLVEFGPRQPLSLSGGERRCVALAGVLAMNPEVLVLDEPTAGLDPRTTASLCKLFVELSNQGRTLVLISHDMELVGHLATHVVVLRHGRIELQGPTRAVLAHPEFESISGLVPPMSVQLARLLRQRGLTLAGDPLTLRETIDWLAPLVALSHV
ncbi:MAG: ATP-binding cassette domain-containing protein [Candidatus Latescibacteria bacterium]|nr:ATP-binding cassette domain-containing protein [Candidatus Latescibacterota bacterium]